MGSQLNASSRLQKIALLAGAILTVAAVFIWVTQARSISPPTHANQGSVKSPPHPALHISPVSRNPTLPALKTTKDLRIQFREARNYAEFVRALNSEASAGDPVAEYLTARALKYCHDNAHWRFQHTGGPLRTRNELEVRVGKYPLGLQQEILDAYDRCQYFSQAEGEGDPTSAWESWLDRASAAGYPPAQSFKADVSRIAQLLSEAANATGGDIIPPPVGPARDLAIEAAVSGGPDAIFSMMNWVDGTKYSSEKYWALSSAWGLLACQRGYDGCGPTSPWLRSICNLDAQCADDSSVIDTMKRQFGGRFEDVQNLARKIGQAIDNKDPTAMESYL